MAARSFSLARSAFIFVIASATVVKAEANDCAALSLLQHSVKRLPIEALGAGAGGSGPGEAEAVHATVGLSRITGTEVQVDLPAGYTLMGVSSESSGVSTFLGVPYAAPPVADLRWRSPQPAELPAGRVLQATEPRPNCVQPEFMRRKIAHPEWASIGAWPSLASGPTNALRPSEDCLYVNVYAPGGALDNNTALRPVLVWIPGGNGMFGGSNDKHLDGRMLAEAMNAVVVVMNYRLGVLGWGFHPSVNSRNEEPETPALSHQDQRAALQWTKDNIKAFGGNPDMVTLGGESSAAVDVYMHLLHPKSFPLFQRALISSAGGVLVPNLFADSSWTMDPTWPWNSGSDWQDTVWQDAWNNEFGKVLSQAPCGPADSKSVDLECLLELPADSLDPLGHFIDAPWNPFPPSWVAGQTPPPNIAVMIGFNAGDGAQADTDMASLSYESEMGELHKWANNNFGGMGPIVAQTYSTAPEVKPFGYPMPPSNLSDAYRRWIDGMTDYGFACPTFEAASIFQDLGLNTYVYQFDRAPASHFLMCDAVDCDGTETEENFIEAGACHGCDIPFWFMNKPDLTEDEFEVSKVMVGYLGNFAATGNPNKGDYTPAKIWNQAVPKDQVDGLTSSWLQTWRPPTPSNVHLLKFGAPLVESISADLEARSHCQMWSAIELDSRTRGRSLAFAYSLIMAVGLVMITALLVALALWPGWGEKRGAAAPAQQVILTGAPASVLEGPLDTYPEDKTVYQLFCECAEQQACQAAVEADFAQPVTLSYAALLDRAEGVSRALRAAGAEEGETVPVLMELGVPLVGAVMGILGAGCAWAALDPTSPPERKLNLIRALNASKVVADATIEVPQTPLGELTVVRVDADGCASGAWGRDADMRLPLAPSQRELCGEPHAMTVFTSGSTGEPKGVIYSQRMLLHGAYFYGQLCEMGPGHRSLLKSPHFWAVIEYELFSPLIFGATMLVAKPGGNKQPGYLAGLVAHSGLTSLMITPRVLSPVLEELRSAQATRGLALRHTVCIGEALRGDVVMDYHATLGVGPQIHNVYGPSEASCTVWSSPPGRVQGEGNVLAGTPQPHVVVHLLKYTGEGAWQKVPEGGEGEIYIGGVISPGYLNNPGETTAKFVQVPGIKGKLYGTGDLGKLVGGDLQVLGRIDRQLNVSGVRIEPGEIEAALKRVAADAIVMAWGEPERVVALCAPRKEEGKNTQAAKQACSTRLPEYMVPKVICWVDQLPTLPNGKVDVREAQKIVAKAAQDAEEDVDEGVVVLDSLGMAKKLSPEKIRWMRATWVCYAYWSFGVVVDHWMGCDPKLWKCTSLSMVVPHWAELLFRSVGNVQDLCGFLMLGAFSDAQEPSATRCSLGAKEFMIWTMHLSVYLLIPVVDFLTPWQEGYPKASNANVHRWYLWMYLIARVQLSVFTKLRLPPAVQVGIAVFAAYMCPQSGILDTCLALGEPSTMWAKSAMNVGMLLFPSYCTGDNNHQPGASDLRQMQHAGCTCAACGPLELAYVAFYLAAFYLSGYLKQILNYTPSLVFATGLFTGVIALIGNVPSLSEDQYIFAAFVLVCLLVVCFEHLWVAGRTIQVPSAVLLGLCFLSQITVARYYYPMTSLEQGLVALNSPLQLAICTLQPLLFLAAALQLVPQSGDERSQGWLMQGMKVMGSAALGTYISHFYFTPTAGALLRDGAFYLGAGTDGVASSVLRTMWTVIVPLAYILFIGPFFQKILFAPATIALSMRSPPAPSSTAAKLASKI